MSGGQRITIEAVPQMLKAQTDALMSDINTEFKARGFRVANELRNAELIVLRGQRSGRIYNVPGTGRVRYNKRKHTAKITYRKYQASAPGEPPAVRTGTYRNSFSRRSYAEGSPDNMVKVHAIIESRTTATNGANLGNMLEEGTPGGKIKPRPHRERIMEKATPAIKRIYTRRYL